MRTHRVSVFRFVCFATAGLGLMLLSPPRSVGGDAPRPIASVSVQERMRLPDTTSIKLKSGRIVTLGKMREEHRARMESFAKASALGRAVSGSLTTKPAAASGGTALSKAAAGTMTTAPAAASGGKASASSLTTAAPPASGGAPHPPNAKNPPVQRASSTTAVPPSVVPMPDMNKVVNGRIPHDYLDFCQAANASACVYLPANTTFDAYQFPRGLTLAVTEDPLIIDPGVCASDGGSWVSDYSVCVFTYPVSELTNFKPGVGLSQKADCSGQGFTYTVDPRGAILIDGHVQDENRFITGSSARTCVIQVWTF